MNNNSFDQIWQEAYDAMLQAGTAAHPTPMVVVTRHGEHIETIADGLCGFAWVVIKPATSRFAVWLRKNKLADPAYGGGLQIWISAFNQSITRKEAGAHAMARVFRERLGINAYAQSRLD